MKDDYLANRILRDEMRAKRKLIKETQATDNALLKKASLNIKLVPEHEVQSLEHVQGGKRDRRRMHVHEQDAQEIASAANDI